MLYATTRSNRDAFTPQRILSELRGAEGGLFVPFHNPQFSPEEIDAFSQKSFSQCVAELLNLQFNTKLTSWDVDFAVGRRPVRLKQLNQRILMAELWHNPDWVFSSMAEHLARRISAEPLSGKTGDWVCVGVRIAVLFGIYGELCRAGMADRENPFDISCVGGDFSAPVSAWYARCWGLPVGNIIICCNENSDVWNLICHGQFRTDTVAIRTSTPDADVVLPESLERMIYAALGREEAIRYAACIQSGVTYYLEEDQVQRLRKGLYVAVVSQPRVQSTISGVYGNCDYVLSAYDALSYSGLLDYRSRTGSRRYAVVLSEKSPRRDLEMVASALQTTAEELCRYLNKQ